MTSGIAECPVCESRDIIQQPMGEWREVGCCGECTTMWILPYDPDGAGTFKFEMGEA